MSGRDPFPNPGQHRDGAAERIDAFWDRTGILPLPRASELPPCPLCSGVQAMKGWLFHESKNPGTGSAPPWRCDVKTKCMGCSSVLTFGIPVPGPPARGIPRNRWIHWRTALTLLREQTG